MRLAVTAAFLFVSAVALQQCNRAPANESSGEAAAQPQFKAVATTDQLMDAIIIPNSQAVWDAVVYDNGQLVSGPKTDDEWYNVQMRALAVAEAGNLLKIGPRAKDTGDWAKFSTQLTDRAMEVVRAAERKDLQRTLDAGGNMYNVCTDCHRQYVMPDATN